MDCRSCGHDVAWVADYCSQCGASTAHEIDLRPPDLIEADLPPDTGSEGVDSAGRRPSASWRRGLPAAAGLGLVAVLGWTLLSSAGRDPADDDPASALPSSTTPPTTAAPSTGPVDDVVVAELAPTTSIPGVGPGAETVRELPVLATQSKGVARSGDPVLGVPVGYDLFVGSNIGVLRRLDLDTGAWTRYRTAGHPVLASGDWLLLSTAPGEVTTAVPVADPDAGAVSLGPAASPPRAASPSPVAGQVWLLIDDGRGGLVWELTEIESGAVLATVVTDAMALPTPLGAGPGVATSAAGGVFAVSGDGSYEAVTTDRLVVVADEVVLTERCDRPADCHYRWLNRGDWSEADLTVPSMIITEVELMSPSGRVMVARGPGEVNVVDLERGSIVPVESFRHVSVVSPDGRFVAVDRATGYSFTDLDTGDVHWVGIADQPDDEALFVPHRP